MSQSSAQWDLNSIRQHTLLGVVPSHATCGHLPISSRYLQVFQDRKNASSLISSLIFSLLIITDRQQTAESMRYEMQPSPEFNLGAL